MKCRQALFFIIIYKNTTYNRLFFNYKLSFFNFTDVWMWDLIVSDPDHCLSFSFPYIIGPAFHNEEDDRLANWLSLSEVLSEAHSLVDLC